MYRDDSTLLDEHDRAVGAIQIADGLVGECSRALRDLESAEHRWRAVNEIQDEYIEVWRQLDGARRLLAARGANTTGYDELRRRVKPGLTVDEKGIDTRPLDDARRAIEELRLAIPGADWRAIEERTTGLAGGARFVRKGQHLAFAGVAVVFSLAVVTWAAGTVPEEPIDPKVGQRLEAKTAHVDVIESRKDRIETLSYLIGGRCDRPYVVEYMRLLVMDGQWEDAHAYGTEYQHRCGKDDEVGKWSRMAKKKLDRLSAR